MSQTTDDDRDDAAPVSARPRDNHAMPARPLGFVGLGGMGLAIAVRLAGRFPLLGCDGDPARLSLLMDRTEHDSRVHTTPILAELADRCDVIAVLQPSASDAKRVIAELGASVRSGTMLLDLSASHPAETRRVAAELSDRSVHLLDAALLGTEQAADEGALIILAGGAEAVLAEVQPYLDRLGTVVRTGTIGTGHSLAALLGAVAAAGPQALDEARLIAEKSGIETAQLNQLLAVQMGQPSGDGLEIAVSLGGELGVELPLIAAALSTWRSRSGSIPIP